MLSLRRNRPGTLPAYKRKPKPKPRANPKSPRVVHLALSKKAAGELDLVLKEALEDEEYVCPGGDTMRAIRAEIAAHKDDPT